MKVFFCLSLFVMLFICLDLQAEVCQDEARALDTAQNQLEAAQDMLDFAESMHSLTSLSDGNELAKTGSGYAAAQATNNAITGAHSVSGAREAVEAAQAAVDAASTAYWNCFWSHHTICPGCWKLIEWSTYDPSEHDFVTCNTCDKSYWTCVGHGCFVYFCGKCGQKFVYDTYDELMETTHDCRQYSDGSYNHIQIRNRYN